MIEINKKYKIYQFILVQQSHLLIIIQKYLSTLKFLKAKLFVINKQKTKWIGIKITFHIKPMMIFQDHMIAPKKVLIK